MFNYIFGIEWEDDYRLMMIQEVMQPQEMSQAKSQITWITAYTIHHQPWFQVPYTLTIIDTPEFGDTTGIQRNQEITNQIKACFTTKGPSGVDSLDAVGFVAQSALPRLTPSQRYIFDSILSLFGKDIGNNIIMLLTFADGQKPQVLAGIKEAQMPYKKYFKFNNNALYASNKEVMEENEFGADENFEEMFWKMGKKSFKSFIATLEKLPRKSLVLTTNAQVKKKDAQIKREKFIDSSKQVIQSEVNIILVNSRVTYEDNTLRIRKVEIGEQDPRCLEKVILITGAIGSGKSTFINSMFNYIFGIEWEDDYRLKMIQEVMQPQEMSQAKSQITWITAYTIHHQPWIQVPYTLTIIDTPGFGDTIGIQRNQEITNQIKACFTAIGVDSLDAVGFVSPSALPRLTPSQQYIFDSILSLFGKDIADNIIMLLTFADGQKPQVLAGIRDAMVPYKKFFKFNNSALYVSNKGAMEVNEFGADENFDEMFWKMGKKSFKNLMAELEKLPRKSLVLTTNVLCERIRLENATQKLQKSIEIGHATLNKIANLAIGTKYGYDQEYHVQKDVNEFGATYLQILTIREDIMRSRERLNDTALRLNPLLRVDYIEVLITSEKSEGNPGWKERVLQLNGARSKAILMQEISDNMFDPFLKEKKENRNGTWTKVVKYLEPSYRNALHIDMESYQLAEHEPQMRLSSKLQISSNPTSSLKQRETNTNLQATAASSGQNVSLKILELHFFKMLVQFLVNVPI